MKNSIIMFIVFGVITLILADLYGGSSKLKDKIIGKLCNISGLTCAFFALLFFVECVLKVVE